jgi:hypothetical protein
MVDGAVHQIELSQRSVSAVLFEHHQSDADLVVYCAVLQVSHVQADSNCTPLLPSTSTTNARTTVHTTTTIRTTTTNMQHACIPLLCAGR